MAQPPRSRSGRGYFLLLALVVAACVALPAASHAGTIEPPTWSELTAEQKAILAPFASDWDSMEFWRRSKWLEIAQRYPKTSPAEQQRIQERMRAWAKLTPEQRMAARHVYRNVRKASPEQREALKQMWAEYESLPEADKQRLKREAAAAAAAKKQARKHAVAPKPVPKAAAKEPVTPAPAQTAVPPSPQAASTPPAAPGR